jgi:hypothetical protein
MQQRRRPFILQDAVLQHRQRVVHRHDAVQFGDSWVHHHSDQALGLSEGISGAAYMMNPDRVSG